MIVGHLFQGHALNAVDAKGRVSVPAGFRALIEKRRVASSLDADNTLQIGEHEDGECLIAYDTVASSELAQQLWEGVSEMPADKRRKAFEEAQGDMFGGLEDVKFDGAGRMVLSAVLREIAGIEDLAFFVGVGSTFQIWSPAKALVALEGKRVHKMLVAQLKERGVSL